MMFKGIRIIIALYEGRMYEGRIFDLIHSSHLVLLLRERMHTERVMGFVRHEPVVCTEASAGIQTPFLEVLTRGLLLCPPCQNPLSSSHTQLEQKA